MELAVEEADISNVVPLQYNALSVPQQNLILTLSGGGGVINLSNLASNNQIFILSDNGATAMEKNVHEQAHIDLETTNEDTANISSRDSANDIEFSNNTLNKVVTKEKTNPIKCPLCKKVFPKLSQYRFHMKKHQYLKRFQCEQCTQSFNKEVNLKIHMSMHGKGPPNCPICERVFQRHASLRAHLFVHQVEETYNCLHCKAEFDKEDELSRHLEVHEGEEIESIPNEIPLNCHYCNYMFYDSEKYKEHLRLHIQAKMSINSRRTRVRKKGKTREFAHKCNECPKSFRKDCLLKRHQRIHTGEKPFPCPLCKKCFTQNGTLQLHINRHEGKKTHKCMFCMAKFVQKGNLNMHIKKTHTVAEPGEKLYKCSHCPCVFKKISSLNGHVTRMHSNYSTLSNEINEMETEQPDVEKLIDKLKELDRQTVPQTQSTLDQQQKEPETRPDIVQEPQTCFVKIADSSINGEIKYFVIKQRTVGEYRWYLCSNCNKEFKKPSDLIRHLRIHTREKPFKCPECGLKFAQKSTLKNHVTTHQHHEFECEYCKKKLGSIRSLNVHLKKHDEASIARKTHCFKCSVCEKKFETWETANQHLKLHVIQNKSNVSEAKSSMLSENVDQLPNLPPHPQTSFPIPTGENNFKKEMRFKCHLCTSSFARGVDLKRHVYLHGTNKDFLCTVCKKQFVTQQALKDHSIYHTKPKTHQCHYCTKSFISTSMLERHLITHEPNRPFLCPHCTKRFKTKLHCRRHIKRHKLDEDSEGNPIVEPITENADNVNLNSLSDGFLTLNNLLEKNVNFQLEQPQFQELQETNKDIPQIQIQESGQWLYNIDDIQLLNNSNLITGLLPQFKLSSSSDAVLLNQINSADLQHTNYTLTETQTPNIILEPEINNASFNTIIFNQSFNENDINQIKLENITDSNNKPEAPESVLSTVTKNEKQLEVQDNLNLDNVQMSHDKDAYFDLNLRDYLNVPQLHLQDDSDRININNVFVCSKCNGNISNLDIENHICSNLNSSNAPEENPDLEILNESQTGVENVEQSVPEETEDVSCAKCKKQFSDNSRLRKHMTAKHKILTDKSCTFCKKIFRKKSDMERHVRTHTGEKPFPCPKCDKSFAIKSTLTSHIKTHDPAENKEFQCKVCNSYFSTKASLKTHTLTHCEKQPFRCEICDKTFKLNHHKKNHMQWHQKQHLSKKSPKVSAVQLLQSLLNETNNKIREEQITLQPAPEGDDEMVNASFLTQELPMLDPVTITFAYNPESLQFRLEQETETEVNEAGKAEFFLEDVQVVGDNSKTQVKEKKFQCEVCQKFYVSRSVLRKHQRALHGDYKCDKCSKAFNSMELLETHFTLHDGHRPFNCTLCTNSFSSQASLKVHLKRMHATEYE